MHLSNSSLEYYITSDLMKTRLCSRNGQIKKSEMHMENSEVLFITTFH